MTVTRPQRSGAAGIIPFYIMKKNKVILELSRKDAERLKDLLDGLIIKMQLPSINNGCLHVTCSIVVYKKHFKNRTALIEWCSMLENMTSIELSRLLADRTDPILP